MEKNPPVYIPVQRAQRIVEIPLPKLISFSFCWWQMFEYP